MGKLKDYYRGSPTKLVYCIGVTVIIVGIASASVDLYMAHQRADLLAQIDKLNQDLAEHGHEGYVKKELEILRQELLDGK